MMKTSFLTKQNSILLILQHTSQSTSAVNGSCRFIGKDHLPYKTQNAEHCNRR
jgi:hypothetical protein